MKTAKLAQMTSIAALLVVAAGTGCDTSSRDDSNSGTEDDEDEGGDPPAPRRPNSDRGDKQVARLVDGVPTAPGDLPVRASSCGDGVIEGGEECDDGDANGASRECTNTCVFNACDLDAAGNCSADIHLDLDLFPCAEIRGNLRGCHVAYVTP